MAADRTKRKADDATSVALTTVPISPPPTKRRRIDTATTDRVIVHRHLSYNDLTTDWLKAPSATAPDMNSSTRLQLKYRRGSMLEHAPDGCLLIHACNIKGIWGSGIALALKRQYPKAFIAHHAYCAKDHRPSRPVPTGTAQLLAPRDQVQQNWIGCLFTSAQYGRAKDKPDVILHNTVKAMQMLLELVSQTDDITTVRMCKINSGKFAVPWKKTAEALQSIELKAHWRASVEVWVRPEDEE